jgi:hypothetical protein
MSKIKFATLAMTTSLVTATLGFTGAMMAMAATPAPSNVKYEEQVGGGAPFKVLVDNDTVRATLISMPKGHMRQGGVKRKLDQLLVYIDPAKYSHLATPGTQFDRESQSVVEAGKVTWHDKDTTIGTIRVDEPYRVMYVEIKRPRAS